MAFPLGLHTQAYPYCLQHFGQHNTVPLGLHAFLTYQLIITQNILITQFSELFIGLHPLSRTKPTRKLHWPTALWHSKDNPMCANCF